MRPERGFATRGTIASQNARGQYHSALELRCFCILLVLVLVLEFLRISLGFKMLGWGCSPPIRAPIEHFVGILYTIRRV